MAERAVEEELARAAFERGSWSEAYELFRDLKPLDLPAEDWERYADASWWTGHIEESTATRQKAYRHTRKRAMIGEPDGWRHGRASSTSGGASRRSPPDGSPERSDM